MQYKAIDIIHKIETVKWACFNVKFYFLLVLKKIYSI